MMGDTNSGKNTIHAAEMHPVVNTYIRSYNKRRPHQSLNYQTPDEVCKHAKNSTAVLKTPFLHV